MYITIKKKYLKWLCIPWWVSMFWVVPRTAVKEPEYPYPESEIYESADPHSQLPEIDRQERMKKKFFVCGTPMGCGKTYQASGTLCGDFEPKMPVLVISFKRMLAIQTAARLGGISYTEVDFDEMHNFPPPPCFCICLNSLNKLPPSAK